MGWSWSVSGVSWRWDSWMRCLLLCSCAVLIVAEQSEQQPNTVEAIAFEPSTDIDNIGIRRNITIYWRVIPKPHNIDAFNYAVHVYSNHTLLDMEPFELTNTWARFTNMKEKESYTFRIYATDKMRHFRSYDEITVPTRSIYDVLGEPMPRAYMCGNRRYYLRWLRLRRWTGYTIFWCTARDFDCNGYLNWVRVDGNTKAKLIDVEEEGPLQFFVAANNDNSTSGLSPAIVLQYTPCEGRFIEEMGVTPAPDDTSDTPDDPHMRTDYDTGYTSSSSSYSGKPHHNLLTSYF